MLPNKLECEERILTINEMLSSILQANASAKNPVDLTKDKSYDKLSLELYILKRIIELYEKG